MGSRVSRYRLVLRGAWKPPIPIKETVRELNI